MAGLNLRGSAGVSAGTYAPWTPAAANSSTAGGVMGSPQTISQMAYGVSGSGSTQVSAIPSYGAVGAGIAAVVILAFIWYSLPR